MRCPNRPAKTEPLCFRGRRGALFFDPIIDHGPCGNAPLPFPLLKQITVASAQEHLFYLACRVGTALQRGEITLDGGLRRAQELDHNVCKLVDIARLCFERAKCELNEPSSRAGVTSVIVTRVGPVTAAQSCLVCPIDSSTVTMEAVADCFSVYEFGYACLIHRLYEGSERLESARGSPLARLDRTTEFSGSQKGSSAILVTSFSFHLRRTGFPP